MVHGNALNSYHKAQVYDEMSPQKLILMLYEGAIKRIVLAREGIKNSDPQKRGENLGKAIAIISELNASLDDSIQTEEINFLRGFYAAMLIELPKVSVTEDIHTLDRAEKYLKELHRIWETTVIKSKTNHTAQPEKNNNSTKNHGLSGYNSPNKAYQNGSIAV